MAIPCCCRGASLLALAALALQDVTSGFVVGKTIVAGVKNPNS